ncbi:MAG: hypothetical protein ACRC5C_03430, partial [Bacilli bacterium]
CPIMYNFSQFESGLNSEDEVQVYTNARIMTIERAYQEGRYTLVEETVARWSSEMAHWDARLLDAARFESWREAFEPTRLKLAACNARMEHILAKLVSLRKRTDVVFNKYVTLYRETLPLVGVADREYYSEVLDGLCDYRCARFSNISAEIPARLEHPLSVANMTVIQLLLRERLWEDTLVAYYTQSVTAYAAARIQEQLQQRDAQWHALEKKLTIESLIAFVWEDLYIRTHGSDIRDAVDRSTNAMVQRHDALMMDQVDRTLERLCKN